MKSRIINWRLREQIARYIKRYPKATAETIAKHFSLTQTQVSDITVKLFIQDRI